MPAKRKDATMTAEVTPKRAKAAEEARLAARVEVDARVGDRVRTLQTPTSGGKQTPEKKPTSSMPNLPVLVINEPVKVLSAKGEADSMPRDATATCHPTNFQPTLLIANFIRQGGVAPLICAVIAVGIVHCLVIPLHAHYAAGRKVGASSDCAASEVSPVMQFAAFVGIDPATDHTFVIQGLGGIFGYFIMSALCTMLDVLAWALGTAPQWKVQGARSLFTPAEFFTALGVACVNMFVLSWFATVSETRGCRTQLQFQTLPNSRVPIFSQPSSTAIVPHLVATRRRRTTCSGRAGCAAGPLCRLTMTRDSPTSTSAPR